MEQPTTADLLLAEAVCQLRVANELINLFRKDGDDGMYAAGSLGWYNPNDEYRRNRELLQRIDRELLDDDTDPRVIEYMNDYHDRLHRHYDHLVRS